MPSWHYHFSIWKKFNCETLNYTKLMTNGTCSTSRFQTSVCAHEATQGQQSYKHDLTHDERTPNVVISALKVSQHWDSGRFCYIHRANATFLARFVPGKFQLFQRHKPQSYQARHQQICEARNYTSVRKAQKALANLQDAFKTATSEAPPSLSLNRADF